MCFGPGHALIYLFRPAVQIQPNRPCLSLMRAEQHTVFSIHEVAIGPVKGTVLLCPSHSLHSHSSKALDGCLSLSFDLLPGGSWAAAMALP